MYIAKAFVCLKDKLKCEALYNDIKRLYGYTEEYELEGDTLIICCGYISDTFKTNLSAWKLDDYIDCNFYANGDEEKAIELFLELAKMRDECYKGQWIWQQCNETGEITNLHKSNGKYVMYCFKYATPLELAEAFKQGKINLK